MNSFRGSEILFTALGGALVLIAFILIQIDTPIAPGTTQNWSDPFAAKYAPVRAIPASYSTPTPTPTPSMTTEELFRKEMARIQFKNKGKDTSATSPIASGALPKALATPQQTATPRRAYEKEKVYLLKPIHHAILSGIGNTKKGYTVTFDFEVEPKDTPVTLEVYFLDRVVHSQEVAVDPSGHYKTPVALPKAGLYQWKVKSQGFRGVKRPFSIRP